MISINKIEKDNWNTILNLSVLDNQKSFIESSRVCLNDALTNAYNMTWSFYGIYLEKELIGFAMHGLEFDNLWLDRFMIDSKYQNKGYAKVSLLLIIEKLLNDYKVNEIFLSVNKSNDVAIKLYEKCGFIDTFKSDVNNEEIFMYGMALS